MQELFRKFAVRVSSAIGSIWAVLIVIILILITGYYYHFSIEWENNVSFFVAITALLVLFFLQKSQNHNDKAIQLKLDELIRAVEGARNEVVSVENQPEKDIDELKSVIETDES
jgi:low affinity Fe/Cu permease